jgi:hypothetical protein
LDAPFKFTRKNIQLNEEDIIDEEIYPLTEEEFEKVQINQVDFDILD